MSILILPFPLHFLLFPSQSGINALSSGVSTSIAVTADVRRRMSVGVLARLLTPAATASYFQNEKMLDPYACLIVP